MKHGRNNLLVLRTLQYFLLCLLLQVGTGIAQTITIGTGTSTQRYPLGARYGYERSAALYTSDELITAGPIDKLAWYATVARSEQVPIKIYLKEISPDTLINASWSSMTASAILVYDRTNLSIKANTWNSFTLSSEFIYSGKNNLLVLVESNYGGFGSTFTNTEVCYSTVDKRHQYWIENSSPPYFNGSVNNQRPNIQVTFIKVPQVFTSSTTEQGSTIAISPGAGSEEIVRLKVVTSGYSNPLSVNSVTFNTSGTTAIHNIASAMCYYTTSSTFSNAVPYGSRIYYPSGNMVFTGSQELSNGDNNFWLVYSIVGNATTGQVVDATCTEFQTSESELVRYPTVTDPAGSRTIKARFNGTYTIANSGGDYATLGAAVADLNHLGITGPVTFNITAGQTFTEASAVSITTTGTADNTITFQKSGVGPNPIFNFTGTEGTSDYAIQLLGSDYITFNGIDVRDASTSSTAFVEYGFYFLAASATNGCKFNSVNNCVVDLVKANASSKGVYLASTSATSISGANSDNAFINNKIQDTYSAYYFDGTSAFCNYGNTIGALGGEISMIDNIGGGSSAVYALYVPYERFFEFYETTVSNVTGSSSIYMYCNNLGNAVSHSIYNNTFSTITGTSTSAEVYGLYLTGNTTYDIYGNVFTGMSASSAIYPMYISGGATINVHKNKVHNISSSGSGNDIAYGIAIAGGNKVNLYNNLIYDIKAPASTGTPGVRALSLTGGTTVKVYYNTVYLDYASSVASNESAALYMDTETATVVMKNNSFTNVTNINTGTRAVAFYKSSASLASISASTDYNHYYAGDASSKNLIFYDGTNADLTLIAYKTRLGTIDQNAISGAPQVQHVTMEPFTGSLLLDAATPIAEVLTDINGASRSGATPTIGAYENSVVAPVINWCNLQPPGSQSKPEGDPACAVYAQVFEPGVTEPPGQGAGIQCWIGYSSANTNPDTWTNWIEATFHAQSGDNDEYMVTIPAALPPGTYYYASRFLLTGGMYQYGGCPGGFWDGTTNVSGVLTVTDNNIDWANLQEPAAVSINETGSVTVHGRVSVDAVTVSSDTSAAITAWVGVSPANTDPSTWTEDKWTRAFFTSHEGNNDEYSVPIGRSLTPGTYYYATRYKFFQDPYVYGGFSTDGGNFWDGSTNVNGTLTVGELVADLPYFQNFDQVTAPAIPAGWVIENTNNDAYVFKTHTYKYRSAPNSMIISTNTALAMDDWAFTPGMNLVGGTQYELEFYCSVYTDINREELRVCYGQTNHSTGMTSGVIFWNFGLVNMVWGRVTRTFTPPTSGVYYIGFHGFSGTNGLVLFLDDVDIRVAPTSTNIVTIPGGYVDPIVFTGTGVTIQFSTANSEELKLTVDRIDAYPGGTPPGDLQSLAPHYWTVNVTRGIMNGTYAITLDVTGVPGVNNPATLHLLKRSTASGAWTDLGIASSINGNLLTWTGLASFSEFGIGSENDNPLPVQLSAFNVTTEARNALLTWETATEENAFKFVVERQNTESTTWSIAGEVKANGNSNSPKKYTYTDQKLNSGTYSYRLKMIDNDGTFTYSDVVEVDISVPKDFSISQNYPNPFNPTTKIDYQLPFDSRVHIELYNITGERVATLVNKNQKAGYYTYDFTNTSHLSSGVYIYRIIATSASQDKPYTAVKKMVMMK